MRKVVIIMTGQPRFMQKAIDSLGQFLVEPNPSWEFFLFIGLDVDDTSSIAKLSVHKKFVQIKMFQTTRESLDSFSIGKKYVEKLSSLPWRWKDYLLNRSGSVLEYAQFFFVWEKAIQLVSPRQGDLLLRARTDVVLLSPWTMLPFTPVLFSPNQVFRASFAGNHWVQSWSFPEDREGCIFPNPRKGDKWAIVLRKNLFYLMPYHQGNIIKQIAEKYGDWDSEDENLWWFNAESQFRGCLRQKGFTVFDFSQKLDERHNFGEHCQDFPIYAIQRAK